ncbi:PLC-like phosphodiesterase [Lipomyces japonicus]|uniref:PLC-like phosphodiesterase n=1 Tax=Lipomyces japonicus TaxID=56871 RepID=UPI0034CDAE75
MVSNDDEANYNNSLSDWLAKFSDNVSIASLSIPGTHNSAAFYHSFPCVKCQGASILHQLNNGVRFLDFRVSKPYLNKLSVSCLSSSSSSSFSGGLQLCHGAFPISISRQVKLHNILNDVYSYLDDHPRETVIVSLKNEGPFSWVRDEFSQILWHHYIEPCRHRWFLDPCVPTLGQVRGKIILLRRFTCSPNLDGTFGFPATAWTYNTTGSDYQAGIPLSIQDFCELSSSAMIKAKTEYVESHILRSTQSLQNHSTLFMNFTSASNFWNLNCWPRKVATAMNAGIKNALLNHKGSCGVLVLDFAEDDDWSIVKLIINRNSFI